MTARDPRVDTPTNRVTWWSNRNSQVKHAVRDLKSIAVCGAVMHRRARQIGSNTFPARPCKRCVPRLEGPVLEASLKGHMPWTEDTPTTAAAVRAWTIGDPS